MKKTSQKSAIKTWSTPVDSRRCEPIACAICGSGRFKKKLRCEGFSYVKCCGCGLVQMNPQPLHDDVQKRYREAYGKDYLSYEIANEASFLRLQELALGDAAFEHIASEFLREGKNRLLDIGCATGALLEKLRDQGWDTTGLEISGPQAEYARKQRNLDIITVPLEKAGLASGSFNLVLASHLIEHLNNPGIFVREVYRILAPGAYFLVSTPNIDGFQGRLFGGRWRSAIFDHLYLFSKRTLRRLLQDTGFSIEGISTWGGLAAGLAPKPLKGFADRTAKRFGFGDVMLVKARKGE